MNKKDPAFDFEKALKQLQAGKPLTGKGGIFTPLIKELTEAALKGEIEAHLAEETEPNRRNGYSKKTMKSSAGAFELDTPRDRNGNFDPQIIKKNQSGVSQELQDKIIAMYAQGMGYEGIAKQLKEFYGVSLSKGGLNVVTDKILEHVKKWRERPLDSVYPIVWMDAIFYKIREHGQVVPKAIYSVLGVNLEGRKQVLGLYISETEGAKFWLQVLTDLQNRGVEDILIACVDGLKGFPEAIESIFPRTQVQQCIVHQIRNSTKYISWKDRKAFVNDLKPVYKAPNKEAAEARLDELEEKWGGKYPMVIKSWRRNWDNLSYCFQYAEPIRRIIYTTNAVEGLHRQFRKLTKTKGAFPNENSLLKLLYLGILNAEEKWSKALPHWPESLAQLAIHFEGRLDKYLDL